MDTKGRAQEADMAFDPDRRQGSSLGSSPGLRGGTTPPEMWRANAMRNVKGRKQKRLLTLGAGLVLLGLFTLGIVLMWISPGAIGVTLAWIALFGLPVWVASWVMGADHLPEWYEPEHRILLTEVDDLLGRDLQRQTDVVSRLPSGTLISLAQRRTGEVCLYALGREHPLTPLLVTQIRAASRLAEAREVEEQDEAVARDELDRATRAVYVNGQPPYDGR